MTYQNEDDAADDEAGVEPETGIAHQNANDLCGTNGTFADDDQGEEAHPLRQVGVFEAEVPPDGGQAKGDGDLDHEDDVPDVVDAQAVAGLGGEGRRHGVKGPAGEDEEDNCQRKRPVQGLCLLADKVEGDGVLRYEQ